MSLAQIYHWLLPAPAGLAIGLLLGGSVLAWRIWPRNPATDKSKNSPLLAALTFAGFSLLDLLLLSALLALGLSFGPLEPSFSAIVAVRLGVVLLVAGCGAAWSKLRPILTNRRRISSFILTLWIMNLGILAGELYGMYWEPFALGVSRLPVQSPAFLPDRPLRIVQLSDIHVERITRREREMLAAVQALQPDLIVLTGDYLNVDYTYDPVTQQDALEVLSNLSAPYGVYAVLAPGVDAPDVVIPIFRQLENITLLEDQIQRLDFSGQALYLIGISTRSIPKDSAILHELARQVPPGAYTLLLYHKPDLALVAAQEKIDLYLAGHTHGGQVRLPWYGAIITLSSFGKRFEMGRYQVDQTTLYVSRGIGMEGLTLPRVRFLCPPEIVLIELGVEQTP
jgi:predicted MPP superfamily phosphohydrolase